MIGTLRFTSAGIRVSVERAKSLQLTAFLKSVFLNTNDIADEDGVTIALDISTLFQCLTIFGERTSSMSMSLLKYGEPLSIV